MANKQLTSPLIVILGETGSGKSALALKLAKKFNGHIIAADSRTLYKGLDISTAKPSISDRAAIPHYLIDVITADQKFNVVDFQKKAYEAVDDIINKGGVPFLVGGSGLYIDSLIFNYSFRNPPDYQLRQKLQELSVAELQEELLKASILPPSNFKNKRHLIRSLETKGSKGDKSDLRPNTLLIGLKISNERLEGNLRKRLDSMLELGLIEEIQTMLKIYGPSVSALQTPQFKAFQDYLESKITLEEAIENSIKNELHYAKRQHTWFKRNKSIHWIKKQRQGVDLITTFLNK